jgi:hypothetical protein
MVHVTWMLPLQISNPSRRFVEIRFSNPTADKDYFGTYMQGKTTTNLLEHHEWLPRFARKRKHLPHYVKRNNVAICSVIISNGVILSSLF